MGRGALWRDNQQSTFAHIQTSSSHSTTSPWSPIPTAFQHGRPCRGAGRGGRQFHRGVQSGRRYRGARRGVRPYKRAWRGGRPRRGAGRGGPPYHPVGQGGIPCQGAERGGRPCRDAGRGGPPYQWAGWGGRRCRGAERGRRPCRRASRGGPPYQRAGRAGRRCRGAGRGGRRCRGAGRGGRPGPRPQLQVLQRCSEAPAGRGKGCGTGPPSAASIRRFRLWPARWRIRGAPGTQGDLFLACAIWWRPNVRSGSAGCVVCSGPGYSVAPRPVVRKPIHSWRTTAQKPGSNLAGQ